MSHYFVVVDGQVEGPKIALEIERMVREGQITPEAQMSTSDNPDEWFLLREWRPEFVAIVAQSETRKTAITKSTNKMKSVRTLRALRMRTAYPSLRAWLTFFAVMDFIGAVVFIILIFCNSENAALFVTCSAACLLGLIPLALANVIIDIADIGLRKLDQDKI